MYIFFKVRYVILFVIVFNNVGELFDVVCLDGIIYDLFLIEIFNLIGFKFMIG